MMDRFQHLFKFVLQGLILVAAFTLPHHISWAQDEEPLDPVESLVEAMNVRHIGPGTMSGRVTSITVPHNEPEIIYVGTASGGLWKSTSAGVTWDAIFDDQPTQSIGAVALSPLNPDLVWVGTGEGNPRNSHTSGRGVFKSLDGGMT